MYLTEIELIKRLAEGDPVAFAHVVEVYRGRLLGFAMHYLNDHEMAKDVVQDVFTAIWDGHEKFHKVSNLSSWLFTMAKNQCLKKIGHIRVSRKHVDTLQHRQLNLIHGSLSSLDTSPLIFDEVSTIIQQTLGKLPPQSRRIFEMSRFCDKKNREIAEELDISVKTVEACITKALKLLRVSLRHYLPIVFF